MMSSPRKAQEIIEPDYVMEGAGVLLRRAFGPKRTNLFDPFLLFDHFAFNDPIEGPIVGFPMHPHRGIETVTYMLEGNTRHRDSLGNSGVIGPGDVQWMTSGRGIMHEEMPKRGPEGTVNGFQLWVNLPAAEKMSEPRYQEVVSSTIPSTEMDGARVRVVAGEYGGVKGPVTEIAAQPLYMDVALEPSIEFKLPVPEGHSAVAYLFEGKGVFGMDDDGQGEMVEAVRMVIFGDGDHLRIQAAEDSQAHFVLIAGAPFGEPIVPYGPFVMNTEDEILTALDELKNGTFIKD
jgi:redox-sensitive bicupin YhaK (pirin superfamily)